MVINKNNKYIRTLSDEVRCATCGKLFLRKKVGAGRKRYAMRPSNTVNCSRECSRAYRDAKTRRKSQRV